MTLLPEDRRATDLEHEIVQIKLSEPQLRRLRQWDARYLVLTLWEQLKLDDFRLVRLAPSRQSIQWLNLYKGLSEVAY